MEKLLIYAWILCIRMLQTFFFFLENNHSWVNRLLQGLIMNSGSFLPCHDSQKNVKQSPVKLLTADVHIRSWRETFTILSSHCYSDTLWKKSLQFTWVFSTARGAGYLNEERRTNLFYDNIWLQTSEEEKWGWLCWKAAAKSQLCPVGQDESQNWHTWVWELSHRGNQIIEISLTWE